MLEKRPNVDRWTPGGYPLRASAWRVGVESRQTA